MLRITNLKLDIVHNFEDIVNEVKKVINRDIFDVKISSKAIDARNKNNIKYVYSIDFDTDYYVYNHIDKYKNLTVIEEYKYEQEYLKEYNGHRPIVIGTGPAGLFAGLILAMANLRPIIIERGKKVDDRVKDVYNFFENGILNEQSNVQYGEGGAGTFSDGKLTTNTHNIRIKKVIQELIEAGADESISYISKPHIGSDVLINIVANIRKKIEKLGGEYRFENQFIGFESENDELKKILVKDLKKEIIYEIDTNKLILAIGHSARDTFFMLREKNIYMEKKTFSVGVRIEHKQEYINKSQYGKYSELLPPAEYKLNARTSNGRGIYSFCMCPGGVVVPSSSEEYHLVVNGMSYSKRDLVNANSAILVNVNPDDVGSDVLDGILFQRDLEYKAYVLGGSNYKAPVQLVKDYINNIESKKIASVKPSYFIGYKLSNINDIFPEYINATLREGLLKLDNKIKGFVSNDAIITGVETRTSSPIRIVRDENFNSSIKGLIPSGEGAGYAGGIMSAAVDGIKCAEALIKQIKLEMEENK